MSRDFRSSDARDNDNYVLGRDGQPLVDRYGRPVRRRPRPQEPRQQEPRQQQLPPERPRQQLPPERPRQQPRQEYAPRHAPYEPRRHASTHHDVPLQVSERPSRSSSRVPRRRRRRPRRGCFSGCSSLLAIVLVLAVVVGLWADARLTRVDAFPDQPVGNTSGTNWLLVGSDSRQGLSEEDIARLGTGGEVGPSRTDTIMVLHIPTVGEATLVSIPRDSLVTIPGYGEDKINAAFAYGGPKLLSTTVEQETGLRIDHYMEIGMGGLAGIVDAIGGVEICVEEPIFDPLAALDVQPGCQNLDGATALGYVRTRATAQGDIDRVARQRQFFGALVGKLTSPVTFLNPIRMTSLLFSGTGMLIVGEGDHLWHLGRMALAMAGGVRAETVPVGGFMDTSVGNVVLWDEYAAEELFNSMR
ncbi:LCP family protein [Corynebacterium cystitidis]|uniref:Transcriptional attenuator, LytR family n=1 Tax=Corynebacterium cystitidis DSM 20524 TaxID=1121357 RepID=A0A1H9TES7_9CORY|nr:LCP family protein [Corynebacterium cystitidis]WJY83576.1 Regulatory protein MsrR [Corynebacterium cystitidis DSM 20524]SER95339.1 transcriptional attenuator, LytR family [Corynebacterium cystitidis DSM 20524]SNV91946.1 transcriptional regulator, LytR family [Corynebacterium cystitidis]